jgi:NADH:ubiquinone oxidoreductase subunit
LEVLNLIRAIFTWWNGATLGTRWTILRHGKFVAKDDFGNRYFLEKEARHSMKARRWVIYDGLAEASKVPPEWNAWLHHTVTTPPSEVPHMVKPWEKVHEPNWTGTPRAYHPKGSLALEGERAAATGDYEAWSPDEAGAN